MTSSEFTTFLRTTFQRLAEVSVDGSIHLICMDWRHTSEMLAAANDVFSEFKNLIVWVKDNGGMGTFYRSRPRRSSRRHRYIAPRARLARESAIPMRDEIGWQSSRAAPPRRTARGLPEGGPERARP